MAERKRKWDSGPDGSPNTKIKTEETGNQSEANGAADAAAAIAARIAAQYAPTPVKAKQNDGPKYEKDKPEINDPEFVKDIDINDQRNRYLLTKGPTQAEIQQETGCSVTTKGQWYPDRTMANDRDPPLYLHLTATTQEVLDKGIAKVNELIDQDLGPLTEQPFTHQRRERQPRERQKWPEHKIEIGLESLRNFNVRAKVVGPGGMFVKYIQSETGSRVQIKGMGSGFYETDTGTESTEPMHINITGPDDTQNLRAKELADDLLEVVKEKWTEAKAMNDQVQAQYNTPVFNQPMYMGFGVQPGQVAGMQPGQQTPYGQTPRPSNGEVPPPPSSDAPPLPSADGSVPTTGQATPGTASTADYSAYYAQYYAQQTQNMTAEQQAYYNSPEYKAWYQQYLQYQQQAQVSGTAGTMPASYQSQPQPPLPDQQPPAPPESSAPAPPPPTDDVAPPPPPEPAPAPAPPPPA